MSGLTDEEKLTVDFYNKAAASWAASHADKGYWQKQIAIFHNLLPEGKILEIGCGGGRDAIELVELGYEYTGTDISSGLLKEAKKNVPGQKFLLQSVYDLSFDDKFDGFWCSAVLLHIPKKRIDEALQGIKSILKPKAIGFISIKDGRDELVETEKLDNGETHRRLFSYWSKPDFIKVVERNGFELADYFFREDSRRTNWHCFFVKLK